MRSSLNVPASVVICGILAALPGKTASGDASQPGQWQVAARWHRTLKKAEPGTLLLGLNGVEFRSAKLTRRWKYEDVRTFDLSQTQLTLFTYQNRSWPVPGEKVYRFTLAQAVPPETAARFSQRVGKPVRNDDPVPEAAAVDELPAHRRAWSGGSDGVLRLRDDGIDYVTSNGRDSRSWRWADMQTLANPNPYELRVTGYREIVEFDLKQPLPRDVFERIWDRLYATGLNVSAASHEVHP